ncbi:uncharacterized protein LOC126894225 isoform X2 [Daktulosphaira vitifoliae]|nr:uncharacterized protein LOC126894225 isoform X2 [Daktulosphaira vitifoliae]XP_050521032.1 uncharacterized protein LOC126894225 isoform X2 [Daktulosphaira vitifoliae]XP_050521033.1 uncharacterized protein LOC126894225 isoform X2 [Daktulosphaira vitifoliae]
MLRDWIGLYPTENVRFEEPIIFEYVMDHPRIEGSCFKIKFIPQLFAKYIHCSGRYNFVYVNSYLKVIASSSSIEFMHKNDCNCSIKLTSSNLIGHIKIGQDVNTVLKRLKCLEARLQDYEEGKKSIMQLNEQLVEKLKECEMLRSRGEKFIDGLYSALDQGKPVKLTNSKGYSRWIKRMHTTEIKSHMISNKSIRNEVYLTAIINTQEQALQRLQNINRDLKTKLSIQNEEQLKTYQNETCETDDAKAITHMKLFTIQSTSPAIVKFVDDTDSSENLSDCYD